MCPPFIPTMRTGCAAHASVTVFPQLVINLENRRIASPDITSTSRKKSPSSFRSSLTREVGHPTRAVGHDEGVPVKMLYVKSSRDTNTQSCSKRSRRRKIRAKRTKYPEKAPDPWHQAVRFSANYCYRNGEPCLTAADLRPTPDL